MHDVVDENLISSINYAELVTKLNDRGMSDRDVSIVLEGVPLTILDFDQAAALATGLLRGVTRNFGFSLGVRRNTVVDFAAGGATSPDLAEPACPHERA
jgi:ribonuclease VapC